MNEAKGHALSGMRAGRSIMAGWRVLQRVSVFCVVLLVWQLIVWSGRISEQLLPSPVQVFTTFSDLLARHGLLGDLGASVTRVLTGVFIGVILAIPAGFGLGWYRGVRVFFEPLLNFMRGLPPIALVPLVVVYLGIGELARTVVLVYAAFFAATIVIYEGVAGLEPIYIRAAQSLGANGREIFGRVVLPQTLPHVLTALRVALGVAWATLVAAELVAAQRGLGALIQNASNFFQIRTVFVGIMMIGMTALLMDRGLRAFIARFVAWRETVEER